MVMTWTNTNLTADVRKLYLNGELVDTDTGGNQGAATLANSAQHLGIGGRPSPLYNIDGKISDTKIFAKELSAANVKELYDDSKVIIPTKNDASGGFLSQTDLTLWAPLTDGAGTIAYDGSGYGRAGTYTGTSFLSGQTGAPQLVEGYNRPMLFGAIDDYVNCGGASGVLNITGSVSLGGWVHVPNLSATSVVVTKGNVDGGASTIQYNLYVDANNAVKLQLSNGSSGATVFTGVSVVAENTWTHVAGTFDASSGTAKIYVNGVSQSITGGSTGLSALGSTAIVCYIGADKYTDRYYFNGLVNEVVVYSSELTAAQVLALAATDPNGGPLPPDPMSLSNSSDLAGYWRNDGNVTWTDRSGNGNDGTVYGSPDALLFKQGYNGQKNVNTGRDNQGFLLSRQNNGAIGFDGTTTFTDVGSVGGAGTFSNCTISVWVNPRNIVGSTTYGRIYDGNYEPSVRQRGPTLQLNGAASTSTYLFYLGADISNYFSAGNMTVPHGQWTNITMTVTTIGTTLQSVVGYVNLNPEGSGSTTDSAKMWVGDIGNLRIGQGYKTGQRFFTGQIGNLQIWDRVLPLSEIQQNYNSFKARFGK